MRRVSGLCVVAVFACGLLVAACAPAVVPPTSSTTSTVLPVPTSTEVAAGAFHTCALVSGGAVKCWGDNAYGQLGNGTNTSEPYGSNVPVDVVGVTGATQITAGLHHSCAIVAGGAVKCWGYNDYGQLGNGTTGYFSSLPVDVVGVSDATQITAGYYQTCAVVAGGAVKCWGYNGYGQLGNGTNNSSSVPVDVVGVTSATQITAAVSHTCAVVSGGAVKCWGYNSYRQLGNGTNNSSSVPVDVVGVTGATQITAGVYRSCAVVAGGAVKCWGYNGYGELGDGTNTLSNVPVDVVGVTGATQITAGDSHTCAVVAGGAVKCWGYNGNGQLGNGTTGYFSSVPVDVVGGMGATQISAGYSHTCAVVAGGAVKCWGYNGNGQLGNGTNTPSSVPVDVLAGA
jgi:alpha-tubulin suppressor-like RCC1 family protein